MALLIGLTGGMGSGKSTVADMFRRLGANVIDADAICRRLVEPGQPAWKEMVSTFGPDILRPDQTLDRKKMAERVFSDDTARHRLEAILHPKVFDEEQRLFAEYSTEHPHGIAILDAALLIESGNYRKVDKVVVVACQEKEQIQRILKKGDFEEAEIRRRLNHQMPAAEKIKLADFVIHNDSTLDRLERQVEALFQNLEQLAEAGA